VAHTAANTERLEPRLALASVAHTGRDVASSRRVGDAGQPRLAPRGGQALACHMGKVGSPAPPHAPDIPGRHPRQRSRRTQGRIEALVAGIRITDERVIPVFRIPGPAHPSRAMTAASTVITEPVRAMARSVSGANAALLETRKHAETRILPICAISSYRTSTHSQRPEASRSRVAGPACRRVSSRERDDRPHGQVPHRQGDRTWRAARSWRHPKSTQGYVVTAPRSSRTLQPGLVTRACRSAPWLRGQPGLVVAQATRCAEAAAVGARRS
jgi:hypothetical protein